MEEIKDKVIVIKSTPSKEKDKIVSLFSLSSGVLKAKLPGVLKQNAKLKFLSQPFCFADVSLVKKGEFYTVVGAYPIETFFGITSSLEKYSMGCLVLEVLSSFSISENAYPEIFVSSLKTLELLEFEEVNPKPILIKFMLEVFKAAGYSFLFDKCSECGGKILTQPYFNFSDGSVVCLACKNEMSEKISKDVLLSMKLINGENFDNLKTVNFKEKTLSEILSLLKKAYLLKFGTNLKSL